MNFGTHDAAAALVIDGRVVAAAEEERFTRVKQTKQFPANAITYCMGEAGIDPKDLTAVALFVDPRLQAMLPVANLYHGFPWSLGSLRSDVEKVRARWHAPLTIRETGLFGAETPIVPVRHHLSHAASTYLTSPFDDALVVTLDGRGEYETGCVFAGRNGTLTRRHAVIYPHSIGYLYSMATRYLGFRPHRDEYKVMGLAGYGSPTYLRTMSDIVRFDDAAGRLRLNLKYFDHHRRPSERRQLYSPRLGTVWGPPRTPGEPITDRHCDIAYAVQRVTEDLVLRYVRFGRRLAPSRSLCLAGGVALNGVANAVVIESGLFDQVFVQPAANDAGTSAGAALACASRVSNNLERFEMTDTFLGPGFTHAAIAAALEEAPRRGCWVEHTSEPARCAAQLLHDGHVIGWFQGRMEFGPRALGARSILAPATDARVVSRINARIKRRELFRPLAPAVLAEAADDYFAVRPAGRLTYPFMLATAKVRPDRRAVLPAVTHVDGTARVQTVARSTNPTLWGVIELYRALAGVPVVLNTSFNGADEPIVCTPADALHTFLSCGLDALVIGQYVLTMGRAVGV